MRDAHQRLACFHQLLHAHLMLAWPPSGGHTEADEAQPSVCDCRACLVLLSWPSRLTLLCQVSQMGS